VIADVIEYWMLLVAGGVQAAAFAFYLPARISLISEVVPPSLLQNAVVLAQMSQEAMRVFAPALAGVLIGVAWFGVGGVFVASGIASAIAAVFVARLPTPPRRTPSSRSPFGELLDAIRYVRVNHEVGLIALVTVGIVMIGFPYLTFLPTLADDRFDVGALGYGVMSGVAGLGAVIAGLLTAARSNGQRPWATIAWSGVGFGVALVALGVANSYPLALLALAGVGASGLVFQTTTQSLLLRVSALEYHGRLQSLVILGFSGFGLMALPLGLMADAFTLRVTLAAMGGVVLLITALFAGARYRNRGRTMAIEIG
jgi:MFS family permease